MNVDNAEIVPIVDVIDSVLRYFRDNADGALVQDIIRVNEPMFHDLYEGFNVLKDMGGAREGASLDMLERQIEQLCHALALVGVNKRFGSLIDLNPNAPEFAHLIDSAYHLSHLLWSVSKQSSDAGFSEMRQRVVQEEAQRDFFRTIRACVQQED